MTLLDRLKGIQAAHGLSDKQFASRLGVSWTLWIYIKQGNRPIRFDVLSAALATFPEDADLKRDVLEFLETEGRERIAPVA